MKMNETIDQAIQKRIRVALYISNSGGYCCVNEIRYTSEDENGDLLPDDGEREEPPLMYTRISEPIEITFSRIPNEEIIQGVVKSLAQEEMEARRRLNSALRDINERRADLLSLSHESIQPPF